MDDWNRLNLQPLTPNQIVSPQQKKPPEKSNGHSNGQSNEITDPRVLLSAPTYCICGGLGWIGGHFAVGHPSFGKAVACACLKAEQDGHYQDFIWRDSGISRIDPNTERQTFLTFRAVSPFESRAYSEIVAWAMGEVEPHPWIYLHGGAGVGKTHLAKAAAIALIGRRIRVHYTTATAFIRGVHERMDETQRNSESASLSLWIARLKSAEYLILDDLGREHVTEWTRNLWHEAIDHRYERRMATLITSNFAYAELEHALARPTIDRLRDTNLVRHVALPGESKRHA